MAALNLPDHQYAGDARNPFAHGGEGEGLVRVTSEWAVLNLAADSQQRIYKVLKDGYLKDFWIRADDLDTNATPLIVIDVGDQDNDDAFIAGSTVGKAGGLSLTNVAAGGVAVEADDYVIVSIKTAAATGAAGTIEVGFRVVNA